MIITEARKRIRERARVLRKSGMPLVRVRQAIRNEFGEDIPQPTLSIWTSRIAKDNRISNGKYQAKKIYLEPKLVKALLKGKVIRKTIKGKLYSFTTKRPEAKKSKIELLLRQVQEMRERLEGLR